MEMNKRKKYIRKNVSSDSLSIYNVLNLYVDLGTFEAWRKNENNKAVITSLIKTVKMRFNY